MVSRRVTVLALLVALQPSPAPAADWSTAGGELFAGPVAGTAQAAPSTGEARLPPPRQPYAAAIAEAAARHGLDPKLLHALTLVESSYNPRAVSPAGAAGLTQLMPQTAAELGVSDRFDAEQNLAGGADYLARQIARFGDVRLGLAAFNAGPSRVARFGRVPDIAETRRYVEAVVACYLALAAGRTLRSSADCRSADAQDERR